MKRLVVLFLVVAACVVAACSDTTPTGTDSQNLNRPIDVAFACYGGLRLTNGGAANPDNPQEVTTSAQPTTACDISSGPLVQAGSNGSNGSDDTMLVKPVPSGQENITNTDGTPSIVADRNWYAFVLQSEPGTVALAQFPTQPAQSFTGNNVQIQDANPLVPGSNGISVGENPVAIGTDQVGCKEVIANAGSCDMSILDINSAIASGQSAIVSRLGITNGSGQPVHAKPAAMAMQPPGGPIGVSCGANATGLAYVAFPGCHLVAAVDTATGVIKDGLQWDSSGIPAHIDPATISCPDECGGEAPTAGTRPVTLDLLNDMRVGRQVLAIGADNSNVLTVVDLDPLTSAIGANAPIPFPLEQTIPDLGITSLAVSPQIGMGGTQGLINDDISTNQMQFIYAVATDNTIHVVEIASVGKECDTQIDPRYLHDNHDVRKLSCLPIGDPTLPRRAGARGPGIELIGDAIPTSVAITKVDQSSFLKPNAAITDPHVLIGYYAFASAANGATYVITIDDDSQFDYLQPPGDDQFSQINAQLASAIPLDIAHQVRDALPNRGLRAAQAIDNPNAAADPSHPVLYLPICSSLGPDPDASGGNSGGARATDNPARTLPTDSIAGEKVGSLPSIRQVACTADPNSSDNPKMRPVTETLFSAPSDVRQTTYPDLRGLRSDEVWTFTWEGSLSEDTATTAVDGPAVRESQMFVDSLGAHLVDESKPFCDAGVEPFDIVQLRGCDPSLGDADCALGYTCFTHPQSKVAGLGACMLKDEADRLASACKPFLTSLRRYTVKKSASGQVDLIPRKHVLRTTPVDGCTDDTQCQTLANYALRLTDGLDPVSDTTAPDPHHWSCAIDPDRAPVTGTGKRCLETCTQDSDCDDGTVCDNGTCMEGVIPPQSCVNAAQRYELRAGEAFTVIGQRSGYVHPIIADPSGACVRDPNANPLQVGRIPLVAPACDPTADPLTGKLPSGGFEANPCEETIDEYDYQPNFPNIAAMSCVQGTAQAQPRPTDAIKFRNRGMQLEFVDPTYPGDKVCIGDRGANLGKIPVVSSGVQISFRLTAGLTPMLLPITPSLPVKVVHGPTQSIWVVDEGDFLSTSITDISTRGKLYRVETQNIATTSLID